jgi:hypothetical protein
MEVELPVDMEVGVTTMETVIIMLRQVVMEVVRVLMEEAEEVVGDMGVEEIITEEAEVDIIMQVLDTHQGQVDMVQVVEVELAIEKIMLQIPE